MTPFTATVSQVWRRTLGRLPVRPHPALLQLQAALFRSQVSKLLRGIRSPRRAVLSIIAVGLAVVWTAQTVLAVLFREPADPTQLRNWIALGLYTYTMWHLLKAAYRPTQDPLEWTPAETEWLHGSPLERADLLGFRFASIVSAATLKAACFCVVMLPDIHQLWWAMAGMLIGLVLVDLLRLAFDLYAWGLSPRGRWCLRAVAAGIVLGALAHVACRIDSAALPSGWLALGGIMLQELQQLHLATAWRWGVTPFISVADVALARESTWAIATTWLALSSVAGALTITVGWLERASRQQRRQRERRQFQDGRLRRQAAQSALGEEQQGGGPVSDPTVESREGDGSWSVGVPRVDGQPKFWSQVFAIAWMQLVGMRYYASSLTVSFLAPMVLSLLPIAFPIEGIPVAMQVGGSLAFYSYVLLPTALKFDFRRNIDRVLIYKRLPLRPLAITLGNLATPTLSLTLFQVAVMGIAHSCSAASWFAIFVTLALLAPVNLLVIALENLTFVYYPYRIQQEGVEIFLRSVLMFTAKGIAAAAVLAMVIGWSMACQWAARSTQLPIAHALFLIGATLAAIVLSTASVALLCRAYQRLDVTTDLPA